MGSDDEVVESPQRTVGWQGLLLEGVHACARDPALLERLDKRAFHHECASRHVDEISGRLHPPELRFAQHVPRFRRQRTGEDDEVGFLQDQGEV